jgi:hypothetical protein
MLIDIAGNDHSPEKKRCQSGHCPSAYTSIVENTVIIERAKKDGLSCSHWAFTETSERIEITKA